MKAVNSNCGCSIRQSSLAKKALHVFLASWTLLSLVLSTAGCNADDRKGAQKAGGGTSQVEIRQTSLLRVLACPDDYNNNCIGVSGFYVSDPECQALFLDNNSYQNGLLANAIWINTNSVKNGEIIDKLVAGKKHYVHIVGTFSSHKEGTRMWSGELSELQYVGILKTYQPMIPLEVDPGDQGVCPQADK